MTHNFSSKDSTGAQFWDERFESAFTPWDQGGVPKALQDFVSQTSTPLVTLIPGCGNGYEVAFLAQAGWDVTAIDFSPAAVKSARAVIGEWSQHVVEADFFRFVPKRVLQLIYERAFFCSLPPKSRDDVVRRWATLLPAGGLLAGFFFFDDAPDASLKGPPFSIRSNVWLDLLSNYFELLEDKEVSDSIDVFAGRERWQIWRRRPVSVA